MRYLLLAKSYQYINKDPIVKLGTALLNIRLTLKLESNKQSELVFPKYVTQEFVSTYTKSSEQNILNASVKLEKMKIIKRNPFIILDEEKLQQVILKNSE